MFVKVAYKCTHRNEQHFVRMDLGDQTFEIPIFSRDTPGNGLATVHHHLQLRDNQLAQAHQE